MPQHSHDSAAKAVELVTAGPSRSSDEGQSAHRRADGRRGFRDRPVSARHGASATASSWTCRAHPHALIITDAAVNIAPTLDDKVDIVQNAIDLAHAMGVAEVRVAILSAMETVTPKVLSTIEAAALCKMADRGRSPAPSWMAPRT